MVNEAQKEKEKGNAAFKAGDYPSAIGHYTAAILADRKDTTYPLNRAAAYLKLGKYEDAERDCNTVLSLGAKNVKAYFRRGQAKAGSGRFIDAQRDFTEALRLEPDNLATKEELRKVAGQIEADKRKKTGHGHVDATFDVTHHPNPVPKRRRVPITIIDTPQAASSTKGAGRHAIPTPPPPERAEKSTGVAAPPAVLDMQESSSRPLKTSPASYIKDSMPQSPSSKSSTSTSATPSTPNLAAPGVPPPTSPINVDAARSSSFAEAKQVREAKAGKVGGGIFRASGQNTVFPTGEGSASRTSQTPSIVPSKPVAEPGVRAESDVKEPDVPRGPSEAKTQPVESLSAPKSEVRDSVAVNGSVINETTTTLFDFVRAWRSALTTTDRWKLLQTIPPSSMPSFYKTSLEPALLVSILEVFLILLSSLPTPETKDKIREYLDGLAKVPRFPTIVLFLSGKEKEIAKEVWRKLGIQGSAPGVWNSLGSL